MRSAFGSVRARGLKRSVTKDPESILLWSRCGLRFQPGSIEKGSQRHGFNWLLYEFMTVRASFLERFRIGVAADEKRGERTAVFDAQPLDGLNPGLSICEAVVGNDEIRRLAAIGKTGQRCLQRGARYGGTPPASKEPAHCLERRQIVIDDDNELSVRLIKGSQRRHGWFRKLELRRDQRCEDREP